LAALRTEECSKIHLMVKDRIIKSLQKASGVDDVLLVTPENKNLGDYATNVAMIIAKKENKNPIEVAESIYQKLNQDSKGECNEGRNKKRL